ncbi:unnamed protein product [Hermetia illucens]|uniref:Glucose-methanol-choline oxidoreductase N-terminal domain-containing protein n=1 Tax=Hermetia illucens TaxID=343691 RepID=A0A7R8UZ64_HERIL|nr:glucose dehydrogenase [FAD, quinone]-like [Hermetia illucens]CAD7089264.1 unnamed protein product [Hermetia illucens]
MVGTIELLRPQCAAHSAGAGNIGITTLLQALLVSQCELTASQLWPKDYGSHYIDKGTEVFDFIVIGGGTAGSVIAGRLSDNPAYRVLLIEAGGDPPLESQVPGYGLMLQMSRVDWNYTTEPNFKSCLDFPGGSCPWPRAKMLGGCSANNAMQFILGNRRDFDDWEKMGNPTWGWNDVYQHFRKTENYRPPNPYNVHGTGGPLIVDRFNGGFQDIKQLIMQAAKEGGYEDVDDFRDGHYLGYGLLNALIINGTRNTPARAFLQTLKPNLQVIKNAIVTKINFDENKRAQSVNFVYTDEKGTQYQLTAKNSKEIILSAGTIETPKLLMLSGIGHQEHLESHGIPVISNLPVGDNLEDHATITVLFKMKPNEPGFIFDPLFEYLIHRTGPLAGVNVLDATGFLDVRNESGIYPSMQVHHLWFPQGTPSPLLVLGSQSLSIPNVLIENSVLGMMFILINPKSRGTIRLKSTDYLEQPKISPNFFSVYDDVRLFREAIRQGIKLERTPTFRKYGIKHLRQVHPKCSLFGDDTDEYWDCYIRHANNLIYHPTGTARMGPIEDKRTVVDPRLRVKGVKRLRVIDASIMPKIVSANIQATVVAIAEKGADFIKEDWS